MTDRTDLLTVRQVSEQLRCSVANVYGLIQDGELPYVPTGRRKGYRIDPADLERFIQERKIERTPQPKRPPRPRLKHIKLK